MKASIAMTMLSVCLFAAPAVYAETVDEINGEIKTLSQAIGSRPGDAALLVKRGDAYFRIHDFDRSIADYTGALKIDPRHYPAYLGRGMALARNGEVKKGIDDLSVYLKQYPRDSYALTKRGVRYLWIGDMDKAYTDLSKAVELKPSNAEAHDDLGVIYNQRQQYLKAIHHFKTTIGIDPSYQKAYHNLAIAYYLTERNELALDAVEHSILLKPDNRNSVLLKAVILQQLGRSAEASELREQAEFMGNGNWSEQMEMK